MSCPTVMGCRSAIRVASKLHRRKGSPPQISGKAAPYSVYSQAPKTGAGFLSMRSPSLHTLSWLAVPLWLVAAGCKDDDSPTSPSTGTGGSTGGTQQVRGTERLGWNQIGDVSKLKFRVYVDNKPVDLSGVTCSGGSGGEAECHAPLPAMSDGTH